MKRNMKSGARTAITHPSIQAQLVGWATPQAHDKHGGKTPEQVKAMRARGHGVSNLNEQVNEIIGAPPTGSHASTESRGQLSPAHSRWLMGYPTAWDDCAVTVTRSSRKSQRHSSGQRKRRKAASDE